ncbi:MAG: 6-pyruvoyl tetrahydropterin synthase family protein [Geitlerinemataceae cyanobacterium]
MDCIINRRAQFSASHRYWLPELSEAENRERFGRCANAPGHGHNYELIVSMAGQLDEFGMVLNLSDIKHDIKREVTGQLDFSYLNDVWPEFSQTLPTTENIAKVVWERLESHLPLVQIRLYEHAELWADYYGNGNEVYFSIGTHFNAARRLAIPGASDDENERIYGKGARPYGHGHNYHLEVTVKGEMDDRTGMSVDLGALLDLVGDRVEEVFDHTFLNYDIPYFAEGIVPTHENFALRIRDILEAPIAELGATLHKLKLIESAGTACEVFGTQVAEPFPQTVAQRRVVAAG